MCVLMWGMCTRVQYLWGKEWASSGTKVSSNCEPPALGLKPNLSSLEEQQVLLTPEQFLQALFVILC